jgi:S1-C subfamily serine protease
MEENESEPGDHREPSGYVNPWPQDPYYDLPAYGPPSPPRVSRSGRLLIYLVVAAVAAGAGAGATILFNQNVTASSTGVSAHDIPAEHDNAPGTDGLLNKASVERRVEPGLVDITATLKYQSETAEGTGMVLSSDGLVLTNNHVIDDSTSVYASLVDSNRTYQAKVIGYDAVHDVALLQLEGASGLATVSFGNSSRVSIGTAVLALGNAQGKGGVTPAEGVINALDRSINASDEGSGTTESLHGMEQTSAQIQQGDSGGALADNAGQVIGMITAANTSSSQPDGTIGFAIPINTALSIARQIAAGNPSATVYIGDPGFLGVIVATSSSVNPRKQSTDELHYLQQHGDSGTAAPAGSGPYGCIQNDPQVTVPTKVAATPAGVLIIDVICGTAGSSMGLQAGDVITAVDGLAVAVPSTLGANLIRFHPGDKVTLSWISTSGVKHTTVITLGPGPVH